MNLCLAVDPPFFYVAKFMLQVLLTVFLLHYEILPTILVIRVVKVTIIIVIITIIVITVMIKNNNKNNNNNGLLDPKHNIT